LRAVVYLTKARTFYGATARSFEVQLVDDQGASRWLDNGGVQDGKGNRAKRDEEIR
jgi:hypothetical protein